MPKHGINGIRGGETVLERLTIYNQLRFGMGEGRGRYLGNLGHQLKEKETE